MTPPRPVPTFTVQIAHKFHQRRTEWVAGFQCLLWGMVLLFPGSVYASSQSFSVLAQLIPEEVFGWLMVVVGGGRIIGLIINGARGKITPWVRLVSAFLGCGMFTAISLGFASSGVVSVWIAAWPVLAIVELMNMHDAARDARIANG